MSPLTLLREELQTFKAKHHNQLDSRKNPELHKQWWELQMAYEKALFGVPKSSEAK